MLRIVTLNVNGIRAAWRKGLFAWLDSVQADIICLQEIRANQSDLKAEIVSLPGYHSFFVSAEKKGYSGTCIYSKLAPLAVHEGFCPDFDHEGRYLRLDYPAFSVVSIYCPSASHKMEERQPFKMKFMEQFLLHIQQLSEEKNVVLCGDFNIAHQEIDLKNWRANQKNSGFLPEERQWFSRFLSELALCDVFRHLYPEKEQYTWWSNRGRARENNVGWRIDYQITSQHWAQHAHAASVFTQQWFSDHAPLIIDYALTGN